MAFIACNNVDNRSPRTNLLYSDSVSVISFHIDGGRNYLLLDQPNKAHFLNTTDFRFSVYGPGIRTIGTTDQTFKVEITPKEVYLKDGKLPIIISIIKNEEIEKVEYSIKVKKTNANNTL